MKTKFFLFVTGFIFMVSPAWSQGLDWGDAPDPPYPTLAASGGASHFIMPGMMMGIYIDAEPDGQPFWPPAQGDDQNNLDDADGVIFNSWINPGVGASVIITVSLPGMIDAWIDFNIDGDWNDPGEQIFMAMPVVPGVNYLTFMYPLPPIGVGQSYARVRYSTPGMLTPFGLAPDGEVEDYQVWLGNPPIGDIYLDPDPTFTLTQNEISLALIPDPNYGNPPLIVAAYNDEPFPGGPGMGVSYSADGGNTWANTHLQYPINPFSAGGAPFLDMFDPTVCIDDSGHVFVGQISTDYNWGAGPASGLYVHKSTTGGVTWQTPVQVSADNAPVSNPDTAYRLNDRDQIAADKYSMSPYHNNIYITWIKDRGWNMPQPWGDIYFSYSTNGGNSFSAAQRINAWANNMGNMPTLDVAKDGTVYVVWMDYDVQTGGTGTIFLDKSTDGGVTFGPDIFVTNVNLPPLNMNFNTDARAKGAAVVKVMPSNPNELYIVFAEAVDPTGLDEADIFLIKSIDGGNTWSAPMKINDDATSCDQILPWMYIKPNGTIDIAWYDRRNDPTDMMWDIYFTASIDGGNTFAPNTQVNSIPFVTPAPWKVPDKWMGEYPGLVCDYAKAYIAYTAAQPAVLDMNGDVMFTYTWNPEAGLDFGDAPDPSYPTKAINDGARHVIDGVTFLGAFIDGELDGIPDIPATGDDLTNIPDEDGIGFPAAMRVGKNITLQITASANGFLSAWFDFNADGDWAESDENPILAVPLSPGLNSIAILIPATAQTDTTYARFRFATYGIGNYTGLAYDGEVEDYRVLILDSIPEDLAVDGVTINSGQSVCYDALDSIVVAGNAPVVINNGGVAAFIAGNVVLFKPGFQAFQGSTVDAHIAAGGNYCDGYPASFNPGPAAPEGRFIEPVTTPDESGGIRLYPNPNTGSFILEFLSEDFSGTISILNFQGTVLKRIPAMDQRTMKLDIGNLPSGIYLVHIFSDDTSIIRKVVKL
jgi:hypothetical protein